MFQVTHGMDMVRSSLVAVVTACSYCYNGRTYSSCVVCAEFGQLQRLILRSEPLQSLQCHLYLYKFGIFNHIC